MIRALGAAFVVASTSLGCAPQVSAPPATPAERLLRDGPTLVDREEVGRWYMAELVAPGGSVEGAKRARERAEQLGQKSAYTWLSQGVDDLSHGELKASAQAFFEGLKLLRGRKADDTAALAWFAANHLLALDGSVPGLYREAKPWVIEALASPGQLGWRARGELVEWWSRHAFEEAETDLLPKISGLFGCADEGRFAGPFGKAVGPDRWRHFAAEKPGPWPARFAADPARARAPRVLRAEKVGCALRSAEPTGPGIFYAETYVDVPAEREVIIAVQGSLAVWVDDHQVLDRDVRVWGVWPNFGVHLRLTAGRHRVLARLTEPETGIRLLNPDGSPSQLKTSADASASYVTSKPEVVSNPNVLSKHLTRGDVRPPADELEAYVASHLAAIESQHDVANVLLEPLLKDQERATALTLATAALYSEKDPIFPESDGRDLQRILREKAVARDPRLYGSRLWLSLDKVEKAPSEAVRAVKALSQEFAEVPEVPRILVGLYARLGYRAERVSATLALVSKFADDRGALGAAIPVLEEAGRLKEADELAKRLKAKYPDSEIELDRAIARKDYKAAIDELTRLGKRRPDRKDIADRVAALMLRAGMKADVIGQLEAQLKKHPRDAGARLSLADARFAGGDAGALRKALASAIQEGASSDELRSAIELVEGTTELEPYRIDGRDVIKQYEADTTALEGTAARVLDYSALWIHPDGSARMLEHEIIRVQSQEAIGKLAEHRVPQGALVLKMRVRKRDGSVLEPERVEGKPTVTMPHLEVGDYIETEHVFSTDGDGEGGKRYVSPQWFFREADIAYWRSEFVVVAPKERKLVIETTGPVPPAQESVQGPLAIRRWRVDRTPAATIEPNSVPVQEFLPSVRLGWGLSLEGQLDRLLDAASDEPPRDPRLTRLAQHIADEGGKTADVQEKARRLYRWIVANVEDGREGDGRKVVVGKSGSRAAGFLYLARALGLPIELAVVKDRLRPRDEGPLSSTLAYSSFVLRLDRASRCTVDRERPAADCEALWMAVGDRHAPFGFLPAELRGQPAFRLVPGLARDTTSRTGSFDGIVYDGSINLRADGSATLTLEQRFHGKLAIGVRSTLEQMPEDQLRGVVEGRLLARALPGARLRDLNVVGKDDLDQPLTLRMEVEVSDFARKRDSQLVIKPPFMMKIAASMAPLDARKTPMLLPEATHSEVHLRIKLPEGSKLLAPLLRDEQQDGDRVFKVRDVEGPGQVVLDRVLDVPAGRITEGEYGAFRRFAIGVDEAASREIVLQLR